jgi:nucleotide-binding universal stress UspA family protein
MKIICATDLSPNTRHVSDAASAVSRRFKGELTVVHAVDVPSAHALPEPIQTNWTAEAKAALRRMVKSVPQHDTKIGERVLAGVPDEALIRHAVEAEPDLLVMGPLGKRDVDRWLIGSTAERVLEASPTPVLLVRDAKAFRAWSEQEKPLNVFFAYDFDATSDLALAFLARWVLDGRVELTLAHVDWPPEEYQRLGIHRTMSLTTNDSEVQAILERDLRSRVRKHLGDTPVKIVVEPSFGRNDVTLLRLIEKAQPDLVVCGTHQRAGLSRFWKGSVSLELARHCSTNVLLVPAVRGREEGISVHRTILAVTDFSDAGNLAVHRAHSLLPAGGTVHLLHVTEPMRRRSELGPNFESESETASDQLRRLKELDARLRRLVPADAGKHGIKACFEIAEDGDVAAAICQAAERLGVDAISIGSGGSSRLKKMINGSVTQGVLSRSNRPVFVIKPPQS